jgi:hypothetical protein
MRHSPASLERLQAVLDRSAKGAGEHLRQTFEIPDHTLSAHQLVRYLDKPQSVALATVSKRGEPRVAPVHAVFYDATFHVPTVAGAVRMKHVSRQPSVSLTHWVLNHVAIIVHGTASVLQPGHPDSAALDELYRAAWWRSVRQTGDGVYLRVEAERLFAWAQDPAQFPGEPDADVPTARRDPL